MTVIDYIIIGIIVLVISLAIIYVVRAKKKGTKCIGCPNANSCAGSCSGCKGCDTLEEN